jgi:hypothetical protein
VRGDGLRAAADACGSVKLPGMPWEADPDERTARDYRVTAADALRLGHRKAARKAAMRAEHARSRVRRYVATRS